MPPGHGHPYGRATELPELADIHEFVLPAYEIMRKKEKSILFSWLPPLDRFSQPGDSIRS